MNNSARPNTQTLLYTVYFIYFFCGMTLCYEGAFMPEFKEYFNLSYQQQMYTMFAKNIPFLLAFAIGLLIARIGYKMCLSIAMFLFGAGTLLLIPGLRSGSYWLVLAAFFIVGAGFNFELVAGNPLLSGLGPPEGGSSRLNLGNALGAIAQIIAPITLTFFIPASVVAARDKLPYMEGLFAVIGVILALLACFTLLTRDVDISESLKAAADTSGSPPRRVGIWTQPKVLLGFVAIFLALGAEAGLFGLYRNYLEDPKIAGLTAHQSQRMFTVYFALFAAGRLVGAWVQKRVRPAATLTFSAVAALVLLGAIVVCKGTAAIVAVSLIGLFVSIYFPTLYALAIEGLGDQTAQASGLLTMGFLGCAILPVLQGRLADSFGLQQSYALCFVAYLFVLFYSTKGRLIRGRL